MCPNQPETHQGSKINESSESKEDMETHISEKYTLDLYSKLKIIIY